MADLDAAGTRGAGIVGDEFIEGFARRAEPHEAPDHLMPGAEEERRGHGGIDTAGHGHQDFFALAAHR